MSWYMLTFWAITYCNQIELISCWSYLQACVTIQLHAESDPNMSKAFIGAGCHEQLFKILEYDSSCNSGKIWLI